VYAKAAKLRVYTGRVTGVLKKQHRSALIQLRRQYYGTVCTTVPGHNSPQQVPRFSCFQLETPAGMIARRGADGSAACFLLPASLRMRGSSKWILSAPLSASFPSTVSATAGTLEVGTVSTSEEALSSRESIFSVIRTPRFCIS
jgi:hypothetical protein